MSQLLPLLVSAGPRENGCICPHCTHPIHEGEPSAVCRTCGTVHHGGCWEHQPRCGSYSCAPARVEVHAVQNRTWKISAEELNQAVPLPSGTAPLGRSIPTSTPTSSRNRLALAAFVVALAGIPFFGAITGVVAVLMGCIALSRVQAHKKRGAFLSSAAILLGLADVVGWVVFLTENLTPHQGVHVNFADLQMDPKALEGLPPHLNRAMRATVLLEVGRGSVGSGCILNQDGRRILLVTNRHVVDPDFKDGTSKEPKLDQLPEIQVHFVLGTRLEGKVVWLAPKGIDLALVRVDGEAREARTAQWEANRPLHVGDPVFAIGSPLNLGWTVTQGAVSQFRRQHSQDHVIRVIQTQTALNPGNSGGGLYDRDGYLVGINTWISDRKVSEGIGFAISFETLLDLHPRELRPPVPDVEKP